MLKISTAHMGDLSAAPDAPLLVLLGDHLTLYERLQKSQVSACAEIGASGYASETPKDAAILKLQGKTMADQLRGERAGIDHPVTRPAISHEDQLAFLAGMKKAGITDDDIAALREKRPLSPEAHCRVLVGSTRAMTEMPPEQGARYMAHSFDLLKARFTAAPPGAAAGAAHP